MRCRLNRERRSSWIATTISSPFSKQAEPLCEALIPRIHGCSATDNTDYCYGLTRIRLSYERDLTMGGVLRDADKPSEPLVTSCRDASRGHVCLRCKKDSCSCQPLRAGCNHGKGSILDLILLSYAGHLLQTGSARGCFRSPAMCRWAFHPLLQV